MKALARPQSSADLYALIAAFGVVSLFLIGAGHAHYQAEWARLDRETHRALAAIGELKVRQIESWRQTRLNDARRMAASLLTTKAAVRQLMQNDASAPPRLRRLLEAEQSHGNYHGLLLLATNGRILLSTEAHSHPLAAATRRGIEAALANRQPALTDFYLADDGNVHIDTVAPLHSPGDDVLALVVLRSLADADLFPLIQAWPTPSRSAETILVQREGDEIVFLNKLRHDERPPLSIRYPLSRVDIPAVQAALGHQGLVRGLDYRGEPVLAAAHPVASSPWFVVAKVDSGELLEDARHHAMFTGAIVSSLILLAGAGAAIAYRRRQTTLYRELYEHERARRELFATHRSALYSIGDALITTDAAGRVREMNPIAEKLTGWTEAEAHGQPLETVFRIICESTREPIECPAIAVLRDGRAAELANHTILIDRQGGERPIADSAAPIRNDTGALSGVVLVFSDQTTQYATRNALRASEERLQRVLQGSQQGYWDWNIAASTVSYSDRWFEMLGYRTDELPHDFSTWENLLHPEDRPRAIAAITAHLENQVDHYEMEHRMLTKSGEWRWILARGRALQRDASGRALFVSGTHTDIDDRKRAEQALRISEERLRYLSDNLVQGAIYQDLTGPDGYTHHYPYMSEGIFRLFGVSVEEALANSAVLPNLIHPEDRDAFIRAEQESLRQLTPFDTQARFFPRGGGVKWLHFRSQPRRLPGGDTLWNGLVIDITREKNAELALRKANRAHRVLSAGAEALVRAASEERLMRQACDILVEVGGYRLAWIGIAEHDEDSTVRPAAQAGHEMGYLARAQVTWSDSERGRGPVGTAIRTGRPTICRDVQQDPNFAPWRADATARGYSSVAALPLVAQNCVLGSLNIYAAEPNAFDEEEARLLAELADNLAFGVATLRLRIEAERANAALRASEEKFHGVFAHSPVGIGLFTLPEGRLIEINDAALSIGGYARDDLLDKTSREIELWIAPSERERLVQNLRDHGHSPATESLIHTKDGKSVPVLYSSTLITIGQQPCSLNSIVDISERKHAEEELRASLREKDALLKEVHHRVKNNLQIIASLLRLEMGRIDHPVTRVVLHTMKDRIRSMSLLHEAIYRSENLARVNLADYLFKLAHQLLRSLVTEPGRIDLQLDLSPVHLEIDQAIPCGLLVNELLSNSLKHAFPDRRSGTIRLSLLPVGDHDPRVCLRVGDTGVGLPPDFETLRAHSLGLQLVADLARQIHGDMEISPAAGPGACFAITFTP